MPKKSKRKYHSLSLPVDFIKDIKEHIKDKPGYTSVTDFAKSAIRQKIYSSDLRFKASNSKVFSGSMEESLIKANSKKSHDEKKIQNLGKIIKRLDQRLEKLEHKIEQLIENNEKK